MSIYKRGETYWFSFIFNGARVQRSTKQGNRKIAIDMQSTCRSNLAKGELGIREKKPIPSLKDFCAERVGPWAKSTFEKSCRKNWLWYRTGVRALTNYRPLADARLDEITGELASGFAAHRLREGMQVSTANSSLRVLRRILNLAVEWGVLTTAPKVKVLPGERRRERVISPEEEAKYLAAVPELLGSIAAVLADSGMRPEECGVLALRPSVRRCGLGSNVAAGRTKIRVAATLDERWKIAPKCRTLRHGSGPHPLQFSLQSRSREAGHRQVVENTVRP